MYFVNCRFAIGKIYFVNCRLAIRKMNLVCELKIAIRKMNLVCELKFAIRKIYFANRQSTFCELDSQMNLDLQFKI